MLFGSLFSINALLPKDYQIEISDRKYYSEVEKQGISIICNHCKAEHRRQDIQIKEIQSSLLVTTITGNKKEKLWSCSKCKKDNILSRTKMIQNILPEPCYLKVVPSPPERKDGIINRRIYHKNVEKWALNFFNELQHQMSLFRLEYKPKDEDNTDSVQEGGEELDV